MCVLVFGSREEIVMRSDGKRVKDISPIVAALPYIMPKRYDALNYITVHADMEPIKEYINKKRKEGVRIGHMSVIMAAYYKAAQEHPYINRFIMNSKIYQRNHFCVSFVMLKERADGTPDETSLKVYLEPEDDIISINEKTQKLIEKNLESTHNNSTDKFVNFMLSLPLLPKIVVGLANLMDRLGILPKFIIDLSPFHTSLFITNLASINTSTIYHHCYEFGTTGVFICMGKPVPDYISGNYDKKIMPLGIVMDERISTGSQYAKFSKTFMQYLKHPERLEKKAEVAEEKEEATV